MLIDNIVSNEKQSNSLEISMIYRKRFFYSLFKRLFDLFSSTIAIIILSPILIIISLLIKCTSKGPILYVSKRVGVNGKVFSMYKFRSMKVGADKLLNELRAKNETNGITFKMKNDPRVTTLGKILRKTSLDELPQLFNIFLGTMTIVGPRPATDYEVEDYNDYQRQRLLVKQGLTCVWQCNGRSNTTFEEQIEMDLQYIKKNGFFYDIYIILKTIPAVLFGKGAK